MDKVLNQLGSSVKFIVYVLKLFPDGMNRSQLSEETGLSDRTIGFSLRLLREYGRVSRVGGMNKDGQRVRFQYSEPKTAPQAGGKK